MTWFTHSFIQTIYVALETLDRETMAKTKIHTMMNFLLSLNWLQAAGSMVELLEGFTYFGLKIKAGGNREPDVQQRTAIAHACMNSLNWEIWNINIWLDKNICLCSSTFYQGSFMRLRPDQWSLMVELEKTLDAFQQRRSLWLPRTVYITNADISRHMG